MDYDFFLKAKILNIDFICKKVLFCIKTLTTIRTFYVIWSSCHFSCEPLLYHWKRQCVLLFLVFDAIIVRGHLYLVFVIYILRKKMWYFSRIIMKIKTRFLSLFL